MSTGELVPTDRPTFTIKSGGAQIKPEYQVRSIVVDRGFNRVATAEIVVYDGDPAARDFPASGSADFVPGAEIEIEAGYRRDEETLFKGVVVRHGLRADERRPSVLRVECCDSAVKLTVGRKTEYFHDETDADIIGGIVSDAGLEPDVESTKGTHQSMVQYYATDWDFIVARAEANGLLVSTEDGTVRVKPPDASGDAALVLGYGANMLDFEAVIDARDQLKAVQSSAWNPADQEVVEKEGADPSAVTPGNLEPDDLAKVVGLAELKLKHGGSLGDEELEAWADGQRLRSGYAKAKGRVRVQGHAAIRPGDVIDLSGVGDRFSGTALVSGVHHEINSRNWETDIVFGLAPEMFAAVTPDIVDASAAGLLPGVDGLQVGLVTALEDPDGENRIQVRVPMIDAAGEGSWARMATLDAGEERGSFFLPEIDDEVVVGFLAGDPRNPVVLGMVNSSAKPAPLTASDDNPQKGFVTRDQLKLLFDDEKKIVSIETPNGNTIVCDDDAGTITVEDENKSKVLLDSSGVTIESDGDVTIKAGGDVTIEGANVSLKADSDLNAEGGSGMELKSGGNTVIEGSTVDIN